MADDIKVSISKLEARKVQSNIRRKLAKQTLPASHKVAQYAAQIVEKSAKPKPVISLYNAIGNEFDLRPLAVELRKLDVELCMPVVARIGAALIFRHWPEDCEMVEDLCRILSPSDAHAEVQPDIVLVPLLAFDRKGFRLGYGGGFYDRSLVELGSSITSIGVGFSGQEMQKVPTGKFDNAVNYILTENEFISTSTG